MPSPNYEFREFVDLLLVRLYDLDRDRPDSFFDLSEIARAIKEKVPDRWVADAAKVLASRGLATCLFTFNGTQGQITGEGRLFVEEGRGITQKIRKAPKKYYVSVNVNSRGGDVNVSGVGVATQTKMVAQEGGLALKLLREMKRKVQDDPKIEEDEKSEAASDIEAIEREVKRREPDRSVLLTFLERLSRITPIASQVASLIQHING